MEKGTGKGRAKGLYLVGEEKLPSEEVMFEEVILEPNGALYY